MAVELASSTSLECLLRDSRANSFKLGRKQKKNPFVFVTQLSIFNVHIILLTQQTANF